MTAAFDAQIVADARAPVYLLLLETTRRCANTYASDDAPSTCTAADLGDGARCYYSYGTCQDRANFRPESHTWAMTSADMPLPPDVAAAHPNARPVVKTVSPVAQRISLGTSATAIGHLTATIQDTGGDDDAGPFDLDKSVRNSTRSGLTFQRWLAQWPNMGHMTLTVKLGFLADGFTIDDWAPRFSGTLAGVEVSKAGEWTFRAEDVLARLKKELPRRYSSTVRLAAVVGPADTTWSVTDAGEIRVGDQLLVTGVTAEDEVVLVTAVDVGAEEIEVQREVNGTRASYVLDDTPLTPCRDYLDARPMAIVQDLLAQAGVTEIDAPSFATADLWIGPVGLTRRIVEPAAANKLATEILELFQAAFIVTDAGEVGIAMNRPAGVDDTVETVSDERILVNTSDGMSGEPQRLTHVAVVWGPEGATTVTAAVNGETFVADYFGSEPEDRREKKIESAWIRPGSSVPWLAAVRWSHVFALPPRGLEWDGSLRDDSLGIGALVETDTTAVQDAHGVNLPKRMIVISRRPSDNMARISFAAQATGFDVTTDAGERWAAIAPDATPDYTTATDEEKSLYAFLGDADNLVDGDPGYVYS